MVIFTATVGNEHALHPGSQMNFPVFHSLSSPTQSTGPEHPVEDLKSLL